MGIPGRFASCLARFGAALVVTTLVASGVATDLSLPVVVIDGTPCLLDWEYVVKN